uniref:ACYPI005918 protein n=1 Tax=Acyrthosiphon pisum TaxID=7029 RepID=C4WY28_ACYPI|nr:ACYPI005918 [Acyrthosiphon pisum]
MYTVYYRPLVDIMGGTIFITSRSIMAKIVKPDELGQVMAIYSIVDSLVPAVFGPLYTVIYKNTVDTLPGAYSLIGSTLAIPATMIYFWMYKDSKLSQKIDDKSVEIENTKL